MSSTGPQTDQTADPSELRSVFDSAADNSKEKVLASSKESEAVTLDWLVAKSVEQESIQASVQQEINILRQDSEDIKSLLQQLLTSVKSDTPVTQVAGVETTIAIEPRQDTREESSSATAKQVDPSISTLVREFQEKVDQAIALGSDHPDQADELAADDLRLVEEQVAKRDAEAFERYRARQAGARDAEIGLAEQAAVSQNRARFSAQDGVDQGRSMLINELRGATTAESAASVAGISGIAPSPSVREVNGSEFEDPVRVASAGSHPDGPRASRGSVEDHFASARAQQAEILDRSNAYNAKLAQQGQPEAPRVDADGRVIIGTRFQLEITAEERAKELQASRSTNVKSAGNITFSERFTLSGMEGGRKMSMADLDFYRLGMFADQVLMYVNNPANSALELWNFLDTSVKKFILYKRQITSFQPAWRQMYELPLIRPSMTEKQMKMLDARQLLNEVTVSSLPIDMVEYELLFANSVKSWDAENLKDLKLSTGNTLKWAMDQRERIAFVVSFLKTYGEVDPSTGKLQSNYPGTKALKQLALKGLVDIFFDSKSWTPRLKRVFLLRLGRSPSDVMFSSFLGRLDALVGLIISSSVHTYTLVGAFEPKSIELEDDRSPSQERSGRSAEAKRKSQASDGHSKLGQSGAVSRFGAKRIRSAYSAGKHFGRSVSSRPRLIQVLQGDSDIGVSDSERESGSDHEEDESDGSAEHSAASDSQDSQEDGATDSRVLRKLLANLSVSTLNAIGGLTPALKDKLLLKKEREDSRHRGGGKSGGMEDYSQRACTAFMMGVCTYDHCKYSHDLDICQAASDKMAQHMSGLRARKGASTGSSGKPTIAAISTKRFDKSGDASERRKQDRSHGSRGKDRPQGGGSRSLSSMAERDDASRSDGSVTSE
jgi:hypothetical protein